MPKDLGTWGFILSLAAIVLMYPVGVLINLSSPKIHNWYSSRSVDKAAERANALRDRLQHLKQIEIGHPAYTSILSACMLLSLQLGATTHLLLGALFLGKVPKADSPLFRGLVVSNVGLTGVVYYKLRRWRNRYSARYRMRVAEQLYDAEQRLRNGYARRDKLNPPPTPAQPPTD